MHRTHQTRIYGTYAATYFILSLQATSAVSAALEFFQMIRLSPKSRLYKNHGQTNCSEHVYEFQFPFSKLFSSRRETCLYLEEIFRGVYYHFLCLFVVSSTTVTITFVHTFLFFFRQYVTAPKTWSFFMCTRATVTPTWNPLWTLHQPTRLHENGERRERTCLLSIELL